MSSQGAKDNSRKEPLVITLRLIVSNQFDEGNFTIAIQVGS